MFRIILPATAMLLVGCGSAQKPPTPTNQYCDMVSETVAVRSSSGVNEQVTVEGMKCDDNPIRRLFQVQSGMAPNCGEFTYWMQIGGRNVQRKGVSCQKPDGSWEIVNTGRN